MRKITIVISLVVVGLLSSCIPEDFKQEIQKSLADMQNMMADSEFKKAVGYIEVYKLRNGAYPENLRQLDYVSAMDTSLYSSVKYTKLNSGYELDLNQKYNSFNGETEQVIELNYPDAFWIGLGCVKSNLKK